MNQSTDTPTNKAVREALEAAIDRIDTWDQCEPPILAKDLRAGNAVVLAVLKKAAALLDAETAGVGGDHPQIDGLDDAINNSVMYPMVNDVGFQSEHDRRVVMQAARRYLALTAPAEPEAEGDVEENPHTTLGDIIDFVSENAADLVNKKVCPSDSRDKDLIAVRDVITMLVDFTHGKGTRPYEAKYMQTKGKEALAIINRMIEGAK